MFVLHVSLCIACMSMSVCAVHCRCMYLCLYPSVYHCVSVFVSVSVCACACTYVHVYMLRPDLKLVPF